MRKIVIVLITSLMVIALSSQVSANPSYIPGQTAEAYAFTHGGYVGQAIVKILSDGSLDVEIDEAFLPHTLAIVDMKSADWSEANTVFYVSHGKKVRVAKYVEYDGTVYVGTTVGSSLTYVKAGKSGEAAGDKDLEFLIIKNQGTMAAYHKNIKSGGFKVITGFKGKASAVTKTSYGGVTKSASPKYWNFGQTWQGNINAIEDFIEQHGSNYQHSDMKRATKKNAKGLKTWSVVDAVSGATNTDFKDYFALVQLAIAQLKTK